MDLKQIAPGAVLIAIIAVLLIATQIGLNQANFSAQVPDWYTNNTFVDSQIGGNFSDTSSVTVSAVSDPANNKVDYTFNAVGDGVGYDEIEEEGVGLTKRSKLNFAGSSITCADDTTKTTCTITAGGGTSTQELYIPAWGIGNSSDDVNCNNHASFGGGLYGGLSCSDNVNVSWQINFKVPDNFVSFNSLKMVWASTAASGNVKWKMDSNYGASGELVSTHTDAPGYGLTATGGASRFNVQTPALPLTLVSLAVGDIVGLDTQREGDDVTDTLNAAIFIMGFIFEYEGT